MIEFSVFHVKVEGVNDDGLTRTEVKIAFWDTEASQAIKVEVPAFLAVDLDSSLRDVREKAKEAALGVLLQAVSLLTEHSTDQLHQLGMDQLEKQNAESAQKLKEDLEAAFPGTSA